VLAAVRHTLSSTMMMMRLISRRASSHAVRQPFAARAMSSHWDNLSKALPSHAQGDFQSKVIELEKRKDAAISASNDSVPAIDWAAYESVLGKEAVAAVKAEFNAHKYTDYSAEKESLLSTIAGNEASILSSVETEQKALEDYVASAQEQLHEITNSRTEEDTTLEEVLVRYPEIEASLQADIENEQWDPSTVETFDVTAARMALIEEKWSTERFGPKTEASMKQFLEEIEAGDKAGGAASAAKSDAELAEDLKWAGHEVTDEAIAARREYYAKGQLTAEEQELTDEGDIQDAIAYFSADGNIHSNAEKVKNLQALYDNLEGSGKLVRNAAWQAAQADKADADFNANYDLGMDIANNDSIVEELAAAHTKEELIAAAEKAESDGNMLLSTGLLLEAYKKTDGYDPTNYDITSVAGDLNFAIKTLEFQKRDILNKM